MTLTTFHCGLACTVLQRRYSNKGRRGSSKHRQTCMLPSCAASCSCSESSMLSVHSCCRGACARFCACPSVPACPAAGTAPCRLASIPQSSSPVVYFDPAHSSGTFQGMMLLVQNTTVHMQTLKCICLSCLHVVHITPIHQSGTAGTYHNSSEKAA